MPNDLIRLCYVSTLRPRITTADIDAMVVKAADFNVKHGITGVLAIEGNQICQILEGPPEAIDRLYASIQSDMRHEGVSQIAHNPIEELSFDAWGMVRWHMIEIVVYAMTS